MNERMMKRKIKKLNELKNNILTWSEIYSVTHSLQALEKIKLLEDRLKNLYAQEINRERKLN